jgi:phosphoribosylanthranilate isomerase
MARDAKICGLSTPEAVQAAIAGEASHIGFVFFPESPRNVSLDLAAGLAQRAPVRRVGVFVDADDALLGAAIAAAGLHAVQLHGSETPERVAAVKRRFGVEVWRGLGVRTSADLDAARAFEGVADLLLFDAKPPMPQAGSSPAESLPGGNGVRFDWRLLEGRRWRTRWGLSGGLDASTVADAIRLTQAPLVDVSSGVEDAPGQKNAAKIRAFLAAARQA